MRCGLCYRLFFFSEINRVESWDREQNSNSKGLSESHAQAGFGEIVSDFGNLYSLYNLSKGDIIKSREILQMPVGEVYRWRQLQNRINESESRYQEFQQMRRR